MVSFRNSNLKYFNQFPWWFSSKEFTCNAGGMGWISGSGRSPGKGNGYSLQCSCLENSMDRGACWTTVLQFMGLQRVGQDGEVAHTHTIQYPELSGLKDDFRCNQSFSAPLSLSLCLSLSLSLSHTHTHTYTHHFPRDGGKEAY